MKRPKIRELEDAIAEAIIDIDNPILDEMSWHMAYACAKGILKSRKFVVRCRAVGRKR